MRKKEEFKNWCDKLVMGGLLPDTDLFYLKLESVISEAIAEHEQNQWKKYPENTPENGYYWITIKSISGLDVRQQTFDGDRFGFIDSMVIAFSPFLIPQPYKEGGDG